METAGRENQAGEIRVGDRIRTRKPHPCGSDVWIVLRTGADVKIRCEGCGRIVMLDREGFLRRRREVLSRGNEDADGENRNEA